jgi:hypothetical protein
MFSQNGMYDQLKAASAHGYSYSSSAGQFSEEGWCELRRHLVGMIEASVQQMPVHTAHRHGRLR